MPVLNRPLARIYTPPTCTLEVNAQTSALSRWTNKPAVKSLQFLLSLEGQLDNRTSVELRGDQNQLAELSAAVGAYLQELLARRASDLTVRSAAPSGTQLAVAEPSTAMVAVPQLRPRSLLTHELLFGSLATAQTGPGTLLKVSQLYDLATALDDFAADFQSLSDLAAAPPTWRTALPLARSAAVVLLTVGLGATVWRLFQPDFIATNEAVQAPSASSRQSPSPSASKATPSLGKPFLKPLVLPSIQLPSRGKSSSLTTPAPDAGSSFKISPSVSPSLSPPSASPQPNPRLPGEIALAPVPSAPEPSALRPVPPLTPNQTDSFSAQLRSGAASDQASAPAAKAAPRSLSQQAEASGQSSRQSSSLFDTVPQVSEVRESIAARWKPESLPPKVLEYRLTLNPNGSLAQVQSLGVSAQQYLAQLSLPDLGAPFVSATAGGGRPTIRLVVSPDGTLQTFPDSGG